MEWWQDFGAMLQFMPDTPALAADMSLNGPKYHPFGLSLAYNAQNTPAGIQPYPDEGISFPGEE